MFATRGTLRTALNQSLNLTGVTVPVSSPSPTAPALRVVDQLLFQREPTDALALLNAVVTDKTRYLVLDLDRTIHRARNIGELLGWEVIAWRHYGDALLHADSTRTRSRFHIDTRDPAELVRYLMTGVRRWANPGSRYFLSVKAGTRHPWTRRLVHHLYGPEPVAVAQTLPRIVAMQHLADVPLTKLHELARQIWDRYADDQVFLKADFDALRRRFPHLKIILSSASPQPVLDVAKERLGVDDVLFTSIDVQDGYLSAPYRVDLRYGMDELPRRVAGPSGMAQNAGKRKMPRLKARFPDLADGSVECVGITDTGYGEDHDWANHFTRVVDVNSGHPFSPFVAQDSPVQAIWSVNLRTQQERIASHGAAPNPGDAPIRLNKAMQRSRVQGLLAKANRLSRQIAAVRSQLTPQVAPQLAAMRALHNTIDAAATRYNQADPAAQESVFAELRALGGEEQALSEAMAYTRRPVAALVCALADTKAAARSALMTPWPLELTSPFALALSSAPYKTMDVHV